MSFVTVEKIKSINPIKGADFIEVANVLGYQAIVKKGDFLKGDLAVYIPEGAIVPDEILEEMGLTGRLAGSQKNRVKAKKLKGVVSQGLLYPAKAGWPTGHDVTRTLGIKKWEPKVPAELRGQVEVSGPTGRRFCLKYDIKNMRRFPYAYKEGDGKKYTFSAKIHGTLLGVGCIPEGKGFKFVAFSKGLGAKNVSLRIPGENGDVGLMKRGVLAATASAQGIVAKLALWIIFVVHFLFGQKTGAKLRKARRRYLLPKKEVHTNKKNLYIRTFKRYRDNFKFLEEIVKSTGEPAYVCGEIFGEGMQDLHYGKNVGSDETIGYRIFDVYLGWPGKGRYQGEAEFAVSVLGLGLQRCPVLYQGPYSLDKVKEFTDGMETISGHELHLREGIVIKPFEEPTDGTPRALKSVSQKYLLRGKGTEFN